MSDKYTGTCGELIDEELKEKTRVMTCSKRAGIESVTFIETTDRVEAISEMCRRCPRLAEVSDLSTYRVTLEVKEQSLDFAKDAIKYMLANSTPYHTDEHTRITFVAIEEVEDR